MDRIFHDLRAKAVCNDIDAYEAMSVSISLQMAIDRLPESVEKENAKQAATDLSFKLLLIAKAPDKTPA